MRLITFACHPANYKKAAKGIKESIALECECPCCSDSTITIRLIVLSSIPKTGRDGENVMVLLDDCILDDPA